MKNPYQVLGVKKDASSDDIKKAFKKQARKYHPDVSKEAKATERFTEVNEAYSTLSDPAKRKLYDQFGTASTRPGFDPRGFGGGGRGFAGGGGFPFGQGANMEDVLGSIFGAGGQGFGGPRKGPDQKVQIDVDPMMSFTGGEHLLRVPSTEGPPQTVKIHIPVGATDGSTLRLRGRGFPPRGGGACGDLIVRLHILPHPRFKRLEDDLEIDIPITILEALKGTQIQINTPTGSVKVTIAPGAQNGQRLRLRGKGIQRVGRPGNLYLVIRPTVPQTDDPLAIEAAECLEAFYSADLRSDL